MFYPEAKPEQWVSVMDKLRCRDGVKVSYVWYPESNAEYIEKVGDAFYGNYELILILIHTTMWVHL